MWSVQARNNLIILILSFLYLLCVCTYTKLNLNTTLYKNNFLYVKYVWGETPIIKLPNNASKTYLINTTLIAWFLFPLVYTAIVV